MLLYLVIAGLLLVMGALADPPFQVVLLIVGVLVALYGMFGRQQRDRR